MDSGGHHTQKVYEFAKERLGRRIWAIRGESARGGKRSPVWPTKKPSSRSKASFKPIIIGVNAAKDTIRGRLHIESPAPGEASASYMHFPADRDLNYFSQLLAERSVLKVSGGYSVTACGNNCLDALTKPWTVRCIAMQRCAGCFIAG